MTSLEIQVSKPASMTTSSSAADLFLGSKAHHAGEYPAEGYLLHRLLPAAATRLEDKCTLRVSEKRSNVYLRVKQKNGHMAWSSPVFINHS